MREITLICLQLPAGALADRFEVHHVISDPDGTARSSSLDHAH
ncbi:MAG TPA: hypothetical protein VGI58_04055 [Streptosporangiaceae bacterium]